MKRNTIKLNESQLQSIIQESVKRVLRESSEDLWAELRSAKAKGANVNTILDILHRLEASLEEEGALERYEIPGGYGKRTRREDF